MINIGIVGLGRVGQAIVSSIVLTDDIKINLAFEHPDSSIIGKPLSSIITGSPDILISTLSINSLDNIDILIDFTFPEVTAQTLDICLKKGKGMVIGTTGFDIAGFENIKKASNSIPIVFSPNFSIGISLLITLVKQAASVIGDYDVEIIEAHHKMKKDAPSGTAIRLAEAVKEIRKEKFFIYGRKGFVPRKKNEIGIHAVRSGDIVGDHTVLFSDNGERIEISHRAHSRKTFAGGVIKAVRFLYDKKNGLYDMRDVLSI